MITLDKNYPYTSVTIFNLLNMLYKYLFFGGLLAVACGSPKKTLPPPPPRPVVVVQAEALQTVTRSYTGIVEAEEFSVLAFKVAGRLTALNVNQGELVRKGTVIATINPFDYRLQYEAANAYLQTARAIYERNERLFAQHAVAEQNVEIAQADYVKAGSASNIARSTLEYTQLVAPFSGMIEQKYVENYQEVQVGESIVKLVNPKLLNVRFVLPETSINLIHLPKKIYVEFSTIPGKRFVAEVKEYIYASDGSGIPVTLRITDPDFTKDENNVLPGFSCKVILEIASTIEHSFILPGSAVETEGPTDYVWIVDPHTRTVHRHAVELVRFQDRALVNKGINSHDIIVTAGISALTEGMHVTLLPFSAKPPEVN